jgi:hypothetical protein
LNILRVSIRADPSTIQDKFLVGYQGWFTCPGDGAPLDPHHHGWLHWLTQPIPAGGRPNTDLWPDTSAYEPSELFPVPGLEMQDGSVPVVFSSRNAKTVRRHFRWMAEHAVDGAFLQRFLGQCDIERGNENIRNQRDEVGDRVREAAEAEGRVFAIMYVSDLLHNTCRLLAAKGTTSRMYRSIASSPSLGVTGCISYARRVYWTVQAIFARKESLSLPYGVLVFVIGLFVCS